MPQFIPSITIRLTKTDGEYQTNVEEIKNFTFQQEHTRFLQVKGNSVDNVQETFKTAVKKLQLGRKLPKQLGFTFILSVHDLKNNQPSQLT